MTASAQKFGGPWSIVKTTTVAAYLRSFNVALKDKPFTRVYIDAFAGSGEFQFKAANALPLFDEREVTEIHAGSARHALSERIVATSFGAPSGPLPSVTLQSSANEVKHRRMD